MNGENVWAKTPRLTEAFMELCSNGELSFRQIAAEIYLQFEIKLSRNACIGKARRMNLPTRAKRVKSTFEKPKPKPRRKPEFTFPQFDGRGAGSIGQRIARRKKRSPIPMDPTFIIDRSEDIPLDQRRTFAELENCHCRYPFNDVGEAEFFYCGLPEADVAHGIPYCHAHMDRAYDGIPEPRERINARGFNRASRLTASIFKDANLAEAAE